MGGIQVVRLKQHEAQGTALVAVALSSCLGSFAYTRGGCVSPPVAIILCATALVTARFGAKVSHGMEDGKLRFLFGTFLLVLAGFIQTQSIFSSVNTPLVSEILTASKVVFL